MEHVEITDKWLYQYMPVLDRAIIDELEKQAHTKYEFSSGFQHRMKHLIRHEAHPYLGVVQNILRRVAIFFTGIIGAALVLTMSVEAYRKEFFEAVKTIIEDTVLYKYHVSTAETEEFVINEPKYIPEGYKEIERTESNILCSIVYENEIGEMITWDQTLVLNGDSMIIDSEYDSQIIKEICGEEAFLFLYSDGFIGAYYEKEKYVYLLTADDLSVEEVCNMLESLQE